MAIATAHLRGERDLVDALARDHLVDHPDNVLVAWIAGASHQPDHLEQGAVMNPKLTAVPADPRRRPGQRRRSPRSARSSTTPTCSTSRRARCSPSFRDHQGAVSAWFSVLALSAALLAPIAIGVGRLSSQRAMRIAVPVGIAAAVVQVIGLLRWPILVPGYASDAASANAGVAAAARDAFTTASDILGTAIGETLGYLLTATWTVLVIVALGRALRRPLVPACWARASAALVLVGVLSPLGLPGDRHRELLRLRPLERLADRVRRRDPGPRATRHRRASTPVAAACTRDGRPAVLLDARRSAS